jgi:hypothetical protein
MCSRAAPQMLVPKPSRRTSNFAEILEGYNGYAVVKTTLLLENELLQGL